MRLSKIKWAALWGLLLSFVSLLVHLLLAKSSANLVHHSTFTGFVDDFNLNPQGRQDVWSGRLWGRVKSLNSLYPYANPRSKYPDPTDQTNGFIYAKVFGGFDKIRNSICDLVAVSRLLNATLVIPEIQESTHSKGISYKYRSFSYIYNEDQFIVALSNDVKIVKSLPQDMKESMRKKEYPIYMPKARSSPKFYLNEVLPKLKKAKAIVLMLADGGCLQPQLPGSLEEYQRLRCRVSFHALHFRAEILALGRRIVGRLRAQGQPYLAYHPGLVRDTLAFHGCAELFQDIHTELIQHRRAQLIKQGVISDHLSVDSRARKTNGSCPLMPEEVGLLLRALGYPPNTRIYLAGSEIFGGQRTLIPLRAIYTNLVDRTSLCSKQELYDIVGPETQLPPDSFELPPVKSSEQLKKEWDKAGPRPQPLPPPPDRPIYRHEKEGWYGWINVKDAEPDPSPMDLRRQAHRLSWAALDYIVSVEADAYFPGFNNDGSGWPDFSGSVMGHRLYEMASARTYRPFPGFNNDGSGWPDFSGSVMGHRLYEMASARTYRPDRKYMAKLFNQIKDNVYHPKRNWTLQVRIHLNKSLGGDGLSREFQSSKPVNFLSHPVPECSCRNFEAAKTSGAGKGGGGDSGEFSYDSEVECPSWMQRSFESLGKQDRESESQDDYVDLDGLLNSDEDAVVESPLAAADRDEEMDPDD